MMRCPNLSFDSFFHGKLVMQTLIKKKKIELKKTIFNAKSETEFGEQF